MAPSSLVALLVALAFVSALQQPSAEAIRIPPVVACTPGLPKFIPCYEPKPLRGPPAECWTPLSKLAPCAGFLTASDSSVSSACCDGFKYMVDYAAICFCHYSNGDIGKIVPGTLNSTRLFGLSGACGSVVRLEAFTDCDSKFDYVPPMTPPSPPPSSSLPPAA
ncbi:unnamed protein product [Urochloa decumbens]|uniref:Bifunctional inhibitor/plant lipid transfer protein/seed storage helical domain-containing protein n=1 Tax=Urochloa decumbens TaxID=240449 RepID=A0ABC8VTQ8_9POAL